MFDILIKGGHQHHRQGPARARAPAYGERPGLGRRPPAAGRPRLSRNDGERRDHAP